MNISKMIKCAKEYATKVYQGIPGFTLENARLLFKEKYALVEKYYVHLVSINKVSKIENNLKNSMLITGMEILNYLKMIRKISKDIYDLSEQALNIDFIYDADTKNLDITNEVLKLSRKVRRDLNKYYRVFDVYADKTMESLTDAIVKGDNAKVSELSIQFYRMSRNVSITMNKYVEDAYEKISTIDYGRRLNNE